MLYKLIRAGAVFFGAAIVLTSYAKAVEISCTDQMITNPKNATVEALCRDTEIQRLNDSINGLYRMIVQEKLAKDPTAPKQSRDMMEKMQLPECEDRACVRNTLLSYKDSLLGLEESGHKPDEYITLGGQNGVFGLRLVNVTQNVVFFGHPILAEMEEGENRLINDNGDLVIKVLGVEDNPTVNKCFEHFGNTNDYVFVRGMMIQLSDGSVYLTVKGMGNAECSYVAPAEINGTNNPKFLP